jgi:hypothetical protein
VTTKTNLTVLALVVGLAALLASGAVGGFLLYDHFKDGGNKQAAAASPPAVPGPTAVAVDENTQEIARSLLVRRCMEHANVDMVSESAIARQASFDYWYGFCNCWVTNLANELDQKELLLAALGNGLPPDVQILLVKALTACDNHRPR